MPLVKASTAGDFAVVAVPLKVVNDMPAWIHHAHQNREQLTRNLMRARRIEQARS